MKNKFSLFEAFLPYVDFLFSVEDILEKTSKKSDFDLLVLEKIKEANSKHANDRKSIKKLLDKNSSEFRKKIGFNIKSLTNYYDPIFQYMSQAGETTLEFCLSVANEFHNNYFNKESEDVKQLIIKGEIDFREIIKTISIFREINQISTGSEGSRIGKRLIYEDDDFIVYYPRTHKYFVEVIRDLEFYNKIDWCTRDITSWLKYNKEYACCILIAKKATKDKFKNMQLVSYKITRKNPDNSNEEMYVTDYDETCNFFNHHMSEKEFEDFYPGFLSNIAPRIEENAKTADSKNSDDNKIIESHLEFCFEKRNSEVFEVVLNKYLDSAIEKYYKIAEDVDARLQGESISDNFVEHMTNILNNHPEKFENTKETFFEAISNIFVSNSEPSQSPSYVSIISDFIKDLNAIKYDGGTLIDAINKYIISTSMSSSMHVNFYYYIIYRILDEVVNENANIFDANKKEIGERCVSKILNSKNEIACNTVLTVSPTSGFSIEEILSTEIFKTIFESQYFEKLMLGKIENIQTRVIQGIANLIQDADTYGYNFVDELYNSRPEFNATLKCIADICNVKLVNSKVLINTTSYDRESVMKIIIYNDLPNEMLNSLYGKNYFNVELIKTITDVEFIENNKTKVKSILLTIDRFKANKDLELLNAINDESIPYIIDMNLSFGKTLQHILTHKEDIVLSLLNSPTTDLYDKKFIRDYFENNRHKFIEKFDLLKSGFLQYINDAIEHGDIQDPWDLRNKNLFFNILNVTMKENNTFAKKVFEYLRNNIADTNKHKSYLIVYFLIKHKIFNNFDDSMLMLIDKTIAELLLSTYESYLSGEKIYTKIIELSDIKYVVETIFEASISNTQRKIFMQILLEKVSEFYGEKRTIDLIKIKIENVISRKYYSAHNVLMFIEIYRQFVKEKKISSHLNHALYPTIQKFIDFINKGRTQEFPKDDLKVQNRFENVLRQYVKSLLS